MITIIFSKNRAMQLELCIKSLIENGKNKKNIHVLYTTSDERHENSYKILSNKYPDIKFHKQINFKQDLLDLIIYEKYVLFMVDDNICTKPFDKNEIIYLLERYPESIGFSLRLGKNTKYCYSLNQQQNIPPYIHIKKDMILFNWTSAEADFSYPLELSSSIYKVKDISSILINSEYNNPNSLEWNLYCRLAWFIERQPLLMCNEISSCFCNPINKVNVGNNRSGNSSEYSPDLLLTNFEKCGNIKNTFYGFVPNACHQEVDINIIY